MLNTIKSWFSTPRQPTLADFVNRMSVAASSGEIISPRSILSHPAVWRGVDLLSTSVARIPFDIYQKQPDGSRVVATDHPAQRLLKHKPNRYYHRFQLMKAWMVNALIHGDSYIHVSRDEVGRPAELLLLNSGSTSIVIDNGELYYTTTQDGSFVRLEPESVLHLRGLSTDGICGLPIYQVLAEAFGLGLTMQRFTNVFYNNNGRPSVVIKLPPEVNTREKVQEFREAWSEVHGGGVLNSFKPALLRPGAEITTLQNDNAISSLASLREHDLVMVANILGLPGYTVGAKSDSVSFNSSEHRYRAFLESIDGWLCQIECELQKLLRADEVGDYYAEANRDANVSIDSKTKAELMVLYRRNGLMSDEEIRRKLNLPTDMDGTFWSEVNLQTRERALMMPVEVGSEPDSLPDEPPEDPAQNSPEPPTTDAERIGRELSRRTVERILRRLQKSGKVDANLIEQELGSMPGFTNFVTALPTDELAVVLPEQRKAIIDKLKIEELLEALWTTAA